MNQILIDKIREDILKEEKPPKYLVELLDAAETINALVWAREEIACGDCPLVERCKEIKEKSGDKDILCVDDAFDNRKLWLKAFQEANLKFKQSQEENIEIFI